MPLRIPIALAALLLLVVAAPARAASTSASVAYFDRDVEDFGAESASFDLVILGEITTAHAGAAFGSLSARARYDVPEFSRSTAAGGTILVANASAIDFLTITGGTGAGTLEMTFSAVASSAAESDPGIVLGAYLFTANTPTTTFSRSRSVHGLLDPSFVRDPIPFVFGEPFSIGLSLLVEIQQIGDGYPVPFEPLDASFGYDAITWTGAAVFDAQGDPVPGFAIASESGTLYPVPEPHGATAGLACAGALLGAWRRQRGLRRTMSTLPSSGSTRMSASPASS